VEISELCLAVLKEGWCRSQAKVFLVVFFMLVLDEYFLISRVLSGAVGVEGSKKLKVAGTDWGLGFKCT
jgi:hypothetical protein